MRPGRVFGLYSLKGSLMKKLMMAAAASCLSAGAFAQSSVTIYGSLDAGVAYINNLNGGSVSRLDQGTMQPDRIGFRGTEDLGGNLKAIFQLEAGFYTDSGATPNSSKLFNRYSTIGLSGDFGAVTLGHMPDVVFDYVGKLSNGFQLTNWYLFHPGNLDSLANTYQFDNAVRYTSPTLAGFQGSLMYGFGEVAGDSSNGRNVSAGGTYTNGPFRAALAYSKLNNRAAGFAGTFLTSVGLGNAATVFNRLAMARTVMPVSSASTRPKPSERRVPSLTCASMKTLRDARMPADATAVPSGNQSGMDKKMAEKTASPPKALRNAHPLQEGRTQDQTIHRR